MFIKLVCLTASLLLLMVAANPVEKASSAPLNLVSIFALEEPCVRQGGICKRIEECPEDFRVHVMGLCDKQRHLGVECCYDVS